MNMKQIYAWLIDFVITCFIRKALLYSANRGKISY
jgi:hypothetical protein